MLDINFIRKNPDLIKKELDKRGMKLDIDNFLKLDKKRRDVLVKVEKIRAEQNKASDKIGRLSGKEKQQAINKVKETAQKLKTLEPKLAKFDKEFVSLMLQLPNFTHESTPVDPKGIKNKIIRKEGKKPKLDFKPKDHLVIGESLDIIDVKRGVKVSGARFGYFKKQGALLEIALLKWVMDLLISKGFIPIIPPVLVKEKTMYGTGFFPAEENEYYKTTQDDLYLAGTAEVPLAALHAQEILEKEKLPLKYVGFSSCFRREAGSYGKDTRGIFRMHQFDKIEMFIYSHPKESWKNHEELQRIAEEIVQSLGMHYQVVNICTGDLGIPNAKKYDIEVWLPGQNRYRELTSCSNDTDFQARRLKTRFKDENGKIEFVHTLNSTACAMGRMIIAILENYQQKDGSVLVPKVLRPYLNNLRIIK